MARETFLRALDKMPRSFTSREFCSVLRTMGLTKEATNSGQAAQFLRKYCIQIDGKGYKTWAKKSSYSQSAPTPAPLFAPAPSTSDNDAAAVKFLKGKGWLVFADEKEMIEHLKAQGCEIFKVERRQL